MLCFVVFAVAVGVRLLHWQNNWLTIDNLMDKTAARYQEEAQFLTDRDFTSFVRGHSQEPDTGMLIHTPGYPIFVAVVHAVSRNSNVALRLVHIAGGAAAAVLVLLIVLELLPTGVAILAALFAAVSPQLSFYSLVLLPDSIIGLTILLGIYLLVRARRQPHQLMIIGAGVCLGISCWLRANVLVLAPFLCLFIPLLFPRDKWWRYAVLLVTAAVLTIMPITIRNAFVFKSFIPLTLGTGTNLMEGIADYDPEKLFAMEQHDHKVSQQEAALYNRPDYAEDLYRPDGILRERLRVGRVWAVIRGNKIWFMGVMARRAGKMLTYEPVAIIAVEPSITNSPNTSSAELAWRGSPFDLAASNDDAARKQASRFGQTLRITGDAQQNIFSLATISVQPQSDYLLAVPVRPVEGRMTINVTRIDNGKTVASATVPDSLDPSAPKDGEFTVLSLPFVNPDADQLKIVVAGGEHHSSRSVIETGPIDLYRLGPSSYLWTKYPRVPVKALQKFFTTGWMLPLALFGVVLLALARRFDALAIACAVPLYFLLTHAPLHLELRYILPIHYFWAMLVATSLYLISITAGRLFLGAKRALKPRRIN
ncbi:MAG TPA: glycosyltransferase family 39 protein [Pyrinomonadaceae bacterium]|nr:glycosyltransferase family 39 protein [Pyrinomonadaceae bacterium]